MIKLEEFKDYKKTLETTITNKAFRSRMMFEGIEDEEFAKKILEYISELDKPIDSVDLNSIFNNIRNDTIKFYEKAKTTENLNEKISFALRSLAYFYFLESMDEHSILSDNIINKIQQKYLDDYLNIISQIDRAYLSIDTKEVTKLSDKKLVVSDDLLKKYIVLKEWQDKQHHFFDEGYGEYLEKLQQFYCDDNLMDSFTLEQFTLRKRLFDSLSKKKILDLDTCSILTELYIKKFVVKFIGGKMYGLSVLNSKGIKVPFSVIIPTGINITNEDLKFLKGKYDYYAVRSSADIEDGEKHSFAGMFNSYLNVPSRNILDNIFKVKKSVNNNRLKEYVKINGLEPPNMAVVIQSFKEPIYAGVWIGNSDNSGVLEWVKGNGEKLVSGSSTPHSEIWNDGECANPLKLNNQAIGSKMLEYQQKVGCNADFEWMILDDELIMLQFRPVTKEIIVNNEYRRVKEEGFFGIPASPGVVSGEGIYLDSPNDKMVYDKILLAMLTDPNWLPHLMISKGVVTAYGGFLCHTAIVCRELGIPCVTGIGEGALEELNKQHRDIVVNGNNGNVRFVEKNDIVQNC